MLVIEQIIKDGNCCLMSTYCMLSRLVWSFIYPKFNLVQPYQHYYFSVLFYFALIFNYIICFACLNFHLNWTNKQSNMAPSLLDQLLRSTSNQNSSAVGEALQNIFLPKHESTPYRESILFEAVLRVKIFELTMKGNVVRRFTPH